MTQTGSAFAPVFEPESPPVDFPRTIHGWQVQFVDLPSRHPTVGILTLEEAVVAGCEGFVLDADGTYLIDTNLWFFDYRTTPVFGFLKRVRETRLAGTVLSLLSLWAGSNYYHFLAESVPRLAVFAGAEIPWADVDHVLVPRATGKSSAEVLARLQIPRDKIRSVEFGEYVRCQRLFATSFPGAPCVAPAWAASFLRSLAGSAKAASRRVYIRRGSHRRGLQNEAEIERLLRSRFGFEIFDYQTVESECEAMSDVAVIVGAHGAGLSRMAFCPPGGVVVELLNPNWLYAFYWSLARASGHAYWPVVGRCERHDDSSGAGSHRDFIVDLVALEATVEAAISSRTPG